MTASLVSAAAAAMIVAGAAWLRSRRLREGMRELKQRLDSGSAGNEEIARLASAGRVAAGLAHEVGNPLCAITNYAHSLGEKVPAELRPTVQSLQREVSRIQRMMDGLTDYARPRETGTPGADVNVSLRETLRFLHDQGILRRITVEEHLDPDALPVRGTALELEQAFANLILNAADAMPAGGRLSLCTRRLPRTTLVDGSLRRAGDAPSVIPERSDARVERWVTAHDTAQVAKIVVADSGHGVAHGREESIFEPFVTTKAPEHGTGLGLAIVRGVVNNMGGLVWVQRSREGGAAFHILLPVYVTGAAPPR